MPSTIHMEIESAVTPHSEYGRLDYDPVEDAFCCHVCGGWYHNLAQHARLCHGLLAAEYRQYAGLNRQTRLVTPSVRERLREVSAPLIERLRAEGKLKRWDEDPDKWARDKAAAVATIQQGMRAERNLRLRQTLHKPDVWEKMSQCRRERNLAGLDRASPEAIRRGLRRAAGEGTCANCGRTYERTTVHQTRCLECAREHAREYSRNHKRRTKYANPKPWHKLTVDGLWEVTCPRCEQSFITPSAKRKYCDSCREVVWREYDRN